MGWYEDGKSNLVRVGPVKIVVDRNRDETWLVMVAGDRSGVPIFTCLSEKEAKDRGRHLEVAFASVASWAAKECDTEETRAELVHTLESRIQSRGAAPKPLVR